MWEFGDGGRGSGTSVIHKYFSLPALAKLTIHDSYGCTAAATQLVDYEMLVASPSLVADSLVVASAVSRRENAYTIGYLAALASLLGAFLIAMSL
jgi:hypothetical protein